MAEVHAQSELLLSGDWLRMSPLKRVQLIKDFCKGYAAPPMILGAPNAYRARRNDGKKLFNTVSELGAPKPHHIKQAGRLNRAMQPTLYLAPTPQAAALETKPPFGSVVTILAYRMDPDLEPLQVALLGSSEFKPTRRWGSINKNLTDGALSSPEFVEFLLQNELLDQWRLQNITISKLLALDLAEECQQDLYDLTNHIREHLYTTYPMYQGTSYPSIVVGQTAPNLIIDESFWHYMLPMEVWVTKIDDNFYQKALGSFTLYTDRLISFGEILNDGSIVYRDTDKSLYSVMSDFKQRWGRLPKYHGLTSMLKPFERYRISYGSNRNRRIYDFSWV